MTTASIRFTRTGGFANLRLTTVVDDPDEVGRIHQLLGELLADGSEADGRTRDGFVYEFQTVTPDALAVAAPILVPESALPDALRALTRTLVARARATP